MYRVKILTKVNGSTSVEAVEDFTNPKETLECWFRYKGLGKDDMSICSDTKNGIRELLIYVVDNPGFVKSNAPDSCNTDYLIKACAARIQENETFENGYASIFPFCQG